MTPLISKILSHPGLESLTVCEPHVAMQSQLAALTDETIVAPHSLRDRNAAAASRAGLWLFFDYFEQSHNISQELSTVEGSYWHAILHRREPDFANGKYWFRRVSKHPIFEPLRTQAAQIAIDAPKPAAFLASQKTWDSFAFVDLCETAHEGRADCVDLCLAIQRMEWHLLFDYCFQRAIGS